MQQGKGGHSTGQSAGGRQLPTVQLPGAVQAGMQAGVQYMPCIVPMDQWNHCQNSGAVPIAQVQGNQLQNGALPQQMLSSLGLPLGSLASSSVPGDRQVMAAIGPHGNQNFARQPQMGGQAPPQDRRGRSPILRGRRSSPKPASTTTLPKENWGQRTAEGQQAWATPSGEGWKEPWRPGFVDPAQAEIRRTSVERRLSEERRLEHERKSEDVGAEWRKFDERNRQRASSKERNPTAEEGLDNLAEDPWRPSFVDPVQGEKRAKSVSRLLQSQETDGRVAQSPERQSERRGSPERRQSPIRRTSMERRVSTERRMLSSITFQRGYQQSDRWQATLPSGAPAQAYFVADPSALTQAARRLSFLGPQTLCAFDCQGVGLHAAAGTLCLILVAFQDEHGVLQVFMFDVMQLGEQLYCLTPFLQNQHVPKFTHDAQTNTQVLAHKFGISVLGVIDAGWACESLNGGKAVGSSLDVLDWCGTLTAAQKESALRLGQTPEHWGNRPIHKNTLSFAVHHMAALYAASPVLWERLSYAFGPTVFQTVAASSQHRANIAAQAGLACRQAFSSMVQQDTQQQGRPQAAPSFPGADAENADDADLDDWLAKRFTEGAAARKKEDSAGAKGATSLPNLAFPDRRALSKERLPFARAMLKDGDSPRTAAWRAAVAQTHPQSSLSASLSRHRSSSPSLENWLSRRTCEKGSRKAGEARRASSLPPAQKDSTFSGLRNGPLPAYSHIDHEVDHRAWVEIVEEEQEKEAKECEDDLFEELKLEEIRRLRQAEQLA